MQRALKPAGKAVAPGGQRRPEARDDASTETLARRIAEIALSWPDGSELAHTSRVAGVVPREARAVAWLHDVLECSSLSASDLRAAGFPRSDVRAVELLTHSPTIRSDGAYLAHVAAIADAKGPAGRLARCVKVADLNDRLANPRLRSSGWIPPYQRALDLINDAVAREAPAWKRAARLPEASSKEKSK